MQRTCNSCGNTFEGREDALYCSTACRVRAHRAKTKPAEENVDRTQFETMLEGAEGSEHLPPEQILGEELLSALRETESSPLSEDEEQKIRDHFGYSATERRTKAERDAVAQRILEKAQYNPLEHPAWRAFVEAERRHDVKLGEYRARFLAAHAKAVGGAK